MQKIKCVLAAAAFSLTVARGKLSTLSAWVPIIRQELTAQA